MINVEVNFTDPNTAEFEAAQHLKRLFLTQMAEHENGTVLIFPNVYLLGQKVRQLDLVVIGQFERGVSRKVHVKVQGSAEPAQWRDVFISNFCWCVEVKDHDPSGVQFQGTTAKVRYAHDGREEWKDATAQSDQQLYSLRGHFADELGNSPYVANLLWFRNLGKEDIADLPFAHNYMVGQQTLTAWFTRAMTVAPPQQRANQQGRPYYVSSCTGQMDASEIAQLQGAIRKFNQIRETLGTLSRSKLEKITRTAILKDQLYAKAIGEKLVVIRGRAGTGKTVKLLHIAHDLCVNQQKRCLILTYNKALASDIRRLIALAGVSDDITEPTIDVRTVHAFMRTLMLGFGIYQAVENREIAKFDATHTYGSPDYASAREQFLDRFFLDHYDELKAELLSYIQNGLVSAQDIRNLMQAHQDEIDWDMLLVDESQDWPDDEREILYAVFDPKRFVIADGVDQMVRQATRSNWLKGVDYHKPIVSEKRSLRQKNNLCQFLSLYANETGLPWDVEAQEDLRGGRVIITTKPYQQELHQRLHAELIDSGNQPYEMMFLVPPTLVGKTPRQFVWTEQWKAWGIHVWDGTRPDLRTEYPTHVDQYRLLQYDSCRGLEGWSVVCLGFDTFVSYKLAQAQAQMPADAQQLSLTSESERQHKYAHRWALIALTRAIDTLVLTIDDANSKTAQVLRSLADRCGDFVEWIA